MSNDDLSPEEAAEFLRNMPARPKLLAAPKWHGGSEIPTRERYGDDFERALENFSRHKAVEEHNERLAREHDASVEKHIRDTARRDAERRYEDHKASRITELKARLDAVNGELRNRGEVELQTLTEEQMARLEGMTVMPDNAGSLSTEEYAAARHRRDRAAKLLEMELAFAADMKRKGRR